jgi:thioredoxin-like negative regulator of GroEL
MTERTLTPRKPALVFLGRRRSGLSRKMESLVSWVEVTQRRRLRVLRIDGDEHRALVQGLGISELPALVLVGDRRVLGRLEGRATGRQIEELIRAHV